MLTTKTPEEDEDIGGDEFSNNQNLQKESWFLILSRNTQSKSAREKLGREGLGRDEEARVSPQPLLSLSRLAPTLLVRRPERVPEGP